MSLLMLLLSPIYTNILNFVLIYQIYLFSLVKANFPFDNEAVESSIMNSAEINQRMFVAFTVFQSFYIGLPLISLFLAHLGMCLHSHVKLGFNVWSVLKSIVVTAFIPFDLHFLVFIFLGGYPVTN